MPNPITHILATNLTKWWIHLSPKERLFLIGLGFLAAIAIPLSLNAARNQNRTQIGAQNYYPSVRSNKPPSISTQEFNCKTGQPCAASIKGVDPDITDELRMEVDFLPAEIKLTNCEHKSTLTANLGLTCTLEGVLESAAKYKLVATITDRMGESSSAVISLNVR
jgi:hypothetical protein